MYTYEKQDKKTIIKMTFTKEEWETFVNQSYEKNKEKFNVEGFRKGRAPRAIIEKNYGVSVFFDDALDIAFGSEYSKVFAEHEDFDPIDQPDIKIEKFDDDGLVMVAEVENMPKVTLGKYTGLTIEKAVGEVKEEQVEKELNQARERNARFVDVEREVRLGDIATIDFEGSVDGVKFDGGSANDYRLEIGSHTFIEGFEDQVIGMQLGQSKDVNVKFPEEYQAENLKGKDAVFAVTLKKLEEKQLPELNDEWAQTVSEFNTLEEYKTDIRKHLSESLQNSLDRQTENNILEAVVKGTEVEIPQVLIDRQLDMFIRDFEARLGYQGLKLEDYCKALNTSVEDLKKDKVEQAKETIKTRLTLEEIIKKEKLTLTEKEIEDKIAEIATRYKKTVDEYKKSLGEKQLMYFENEILMTKLINFLKENNTVA